MEHKRTNDGGERFAAGRAPRLLTDESMREIAAALAASPAIVLSGHIVGNDHPTGVMLSLAYEGDDVSACGVDILFWLRWHAVHGNGEVRPPRIIVNGARELPELVRLELDFGDVGEARFNDSGSGTPHVPSGTRSEVPVRRRE